MAIKLRTWTMAAALGLSVVGSMVPSIANADPPPPGADEKAREAYRRGRQLLKEAAELEKQADDKRESAKRAYNAA
ncbi:MAG TPA: hypothetical protein VM925_21950, partial [Labilithrix sp.]|nr:hypothetical protein [Labilithrix sp.]